MTQFLEGPTLDLIRGGGFQLCCNNNFVNNLLKKKKKKKKIKKKKKVLSGFNIGLMHYNEHKPANAFLDSLASNSLLVVH